MIKILLIILGIIVSIFILILAIIGAIAIWCIKDIGDSGGLFKMK